MEAQKPSTGQIALTYGALLGFLTIALAVVLYVTNSLLDQNWITGLVGFLIMLGVIVYGQQVFKKANGGFLEFKDALKVGLGIALIGGILGALYNYIFLTVIEPDFINLIIEKQREAMIESQPNATEAQQEQALAIAAKFARPWVQSSIQVIGGIFFGFIISLISGLILKKSNPHQY
ncbi:DUF4199 domain-containing protein [Leeuwenhoekiella parthenopeia]|uniref:DUF4199 domain-containing protein n=1 Tax=Leeuwenhoekiella parthenopeia TaxID=2890320 RepID=A0ABS8GTE3_9FLAO|nr:DUF4199 domain-containing protein [Leeuwenhoekiella parthenopeia]MCC4212401.1 DUF4199 domain-containing protein [Leeuwenhoekiella parthenopeia]